MASDLLTSSVTGLNPKPAVMVCHRHYGDCHAAAALLLHLTADGQGRAAMLSCSVLCETLDETAWSCTSVA